MCGIAGILNRSGVPVSQKILEQMTRVIAHRGPDGEGFYRDEFIGFGHRRLAVLDLSPAGAQPMQSSDGRFHITYNGEIYNFREIRTELEARGYGFRSRTDTEVILAAYAEWGKECFTKFNGMFTFALWDKKEQVLWLVRDRIGVKPLFYINQPYMVAFASEIKGLLPALSCSPRVNGEALYHFLSLNYTPAPFTLFEGILQLPPAHYLMCPRNGPAQLKRYWDIKPSCVNSVYTEEHLKELLSDSVRLRLISDVEVGAFLSGGVDSSAVVAWMQQHKKGSVKTFTAAFHEASYNEASEARAIANVLETQHEEQVVKSADLELLPKLIWHSEELTADSSMLALYRLSERARAKVKVVLTGDGADELFGGYQTYLATQIAGAYRMVPRFIREKLIRSIVNRIPVSDKKASFESRLRRFVNADVEDTARAHASWRVIFTEEEKRALLRLDNGWPQTSELYKSLLSHTEGWDLINRLLYVDLNFYLPNDMLVKVDRMTMAWGQEARTPYLDYRLVEFVAGLPAHLKCGFGVQGKTLLRRITSDLLPAAVRNRSKAGFNIPQGIWLRQDQRGFVEKHLLDARPSIFRMFERKEIERIIREDRNGAADHSYKIWSLLCLSLWGQQFLDGRQ